MITATKNLYHTEHPDKQTDLEAYKKSGNYSSSGAQKTAWREEQMIKRMRSNRMTFYTDSWRTAYFYLG